MRKVLFLVALVMGLTVAGPAWAAPDDLPTDLPTASRQTFTVDLKPSGDSDGSGTADLTLNLGAQTVCYDITVSGIGVPTEPVAGIGNAHIHSHPQAGAIAVDLDTHLDWLLLYGMSEQFYEDPDRIAYSKQLMRANPCPQPVDLGAADAPH